MFGLGSSKKIAELEERLSALAAERDALVGERDALASRVSALSGRVKSLSDEVVRLRPYAGIADAEQEMARRRAEFEEKVKSATANANKYFSDARAAVAAERAKLDADRERIVAEARARADEIIRQAIEATKDKSAFAAAKRELRERERAEKAAERERVKAEKAAERERVKAEKAAERERERQERERRRAMRPKIIRFAYRNAEFETTTRTVEIKSVYGAYGDVYIRAHCRLRGEERTFRLDRIQGDIINEQTGEVIKRWAFAALYDLP